MLLVSEGQAIRLVSGSSAWMTTDKMMITTVNIQTRVYDYYMISNCSLTSLVVPLLYRVFSMCVGSNVKHRERLLAVLR